LYSLPFAPCLQLYQRLGHLSPMNPPLGRSRIFIGPVCRALTIALFLSRLIFRRDVNVVLKPPGFLRDAFSVVTVCAGPWSKSTFNIFIDRPKPAYKICLGKLLVTFVRRLSFGSAYGKWRMNKSLKGTTDINHSRQSA
jgi:hypothetical protein